MRWRERRNPLFERFVNSHINKMRVSGSCSMEIVKEYSLEALVVGSD